MRILIAFNPFGGIKARALNLFLGRGNITTSNMAALATGTNEEKTAFEKCTKFFDRENFRKHFEEIVPNDCKFIKYDFIYSGVLHDLSKSQDSFDDFFGRNFSLRKISSNGEYSGFRNDCGATHLVGWLNDALGILKGKAFRDTVNRNEGLRRNLNGIIESFKNGKIGIADFYRAVNKLIDGIDTTNFQEELSPSQAWNELRKSHVFSVGKYDCYCVRSWYVLNPIARDTKWCVANDGNSGRSFFDGKDGYIHPNYDDEGKPTEHASDKRNAYYLICEGTEPVALMNASTRHKGIMQFKDTQDSTISIDRPSQLELVRIGNEVRKLLGLENNYDGDFHVFAQYSDGMPDEAIAVEWSDISEWIDNPKLVNFFIDCLEKDHDNGTFFLVVCENPKELLQNKRIYDIMLKFIKGNKENSDALLLCTPLLADDELRGRFVKGIENGSISFSPIDEDPDILKYKDIRDAVLARLKNEDRSDDWDSIKNVPRLLLVPEICRAFVNRAWKHDDWTVVANYSSNFTISENKPLYTTVINAFRMPDEKHSFDVDILKYNTSLLDDKLICKYFSQIIETEKDSKALLVVDKKLELLKYDDVRKAVGKRLSERHQFALKLFFRCVDVQVFIDEDDFRQSFIKAFTTVSKDDSHKLFNDMLAHKFIMKYPDVRDAVGECMRKGKGFELLDDEFLKDDQIVNAFVGELRNGHDTAVIGSNKFVLDCKPVHDLFLIWLENGYDSAFLSAKNRWERADDKEMLAAMAAGIEKKQYHISIVGEFPLLMGYDSVRRIFIDWLREGESKITELLEKSPSFLDYKDVYEVFLDILKNGVQGNLKARFSLMDCVSNNYSVARRKEVRDIYINTLLPQGQVDYEVFKADPTLIEDKGMREFFMKGLAMRKPAASNACTKELLRNDEVRNFIVEGIRECDISVVNIITWNPSLLEYTDVCDAVISLFENGDFFLAYPKPLEENSRLMDGFVKTLDPSFKFSSRAWNRVNVHQELLNDNRVRDAFMKWTPNQDFAESVCSQKKAGQDIMIHCLECHKGDEAAKNKILEQLISYDHPFPSTFDKDSFFGKVVKYMDGVSYRVLKPFFTFFNGVSDQQGFWNFILSLPSRRLFSLTKECGKDFPQWVLDKEKGIDDEDIQWIAEKALGKKRKEKEAKMARRIALSCIIPWKIVCDFNR